MTCELFVGIIPFKLLTLLRKKFPAKKKGQNRMYLIRVIRFNSCNKSLYENCIDRLRQNGPHD